MIQCELKGKLILLLILFSLLSSSNLLSQTSNRTEKRAYLHFLLGNDEQRADHYFLRGDYEKSMHCHELNLSNLSKNNPSYFTLELKIAQLYSTLQNKPKTIAHYNSLFQNADNLLTIDDIYLYIDALRRSELFEQAGNVIRHYITKGEKFSNNQRLLNILNSLLIPIEGDPKNLVGYDAKLLDSTSTYSNYWIGRYDAQPFLVQGRSGELSSNDKIIYHQTRFRKLGYTFFDKDRVFNDIPYQLQHGAMVYDSGKKLLISTDISYRGNDEKTLENILTQGFCSSLLYSHYDSKRDRWSAFQPLLGDGFVGNSLKHNDLGDEYSYAHPSLFNDGNSLLFTSNRPGGYGGMDLYITHWNEEEGIWNEPKNLGREVNSNGDEIYPHIDNNTLLFASNGFEGFGGFDNYRIGFDNNAIIPSTLFHYPYPINSAYNDFGVWIYQNNAFFVSDRQENGRDNIFELEDISAFLAQFEKKAVQEVIIPIEVPAVKTPEQLNIIIRKLIDEISELSIYFEFDSEILTVAAREQLDKMRQELVAEKVMEIEEIQIIGYADLIGSEEYNQQLSMRRAKKVAEYFQSQFPEVTIDYKGRGTMNISEHEEKEIRAYIKDVLSSSKANSSTTQGDQSLMNHSSRELIITLFERYRRVEIVIKTKTESKEEKSN